MFQDTAIYLSKQACPSIAYRIRKDIWLEDPANPEMIALQEEILNEKEIIRIFSLQQEDGWLGGSFHGIDEPESCIRYLMEKGVEPSHPVIQNALQAIINKKERFDEGSMFHVGKPLDAQKLGGSKLMKACVFAYTGNEQHDFVKEMIAEALEVFSNVCGIKNMDAVYDSYNGKYVFKQDALWPSIYHLRLLAYTTSWRSEQNQNMLIEAITNLSRLSPIPEIKLLHKRQIIAPASAFMNHFNETMDNLKAKEWMLWFHRTELIARLGIASAIPAIKTQIAFMNDILNTNNGLFTKKLRHYYYTKWTPYLGLALEPDWRSVEKAVNDLTFRCLLINADRN